VRGGWPYRAAAGFVDAGNFGCLITDSKETCDHGQRYLNGFLWIRQHLTPRIEKTARGRSNRSFSFSESPTATQVSAHQASGFFSVFRMLVLVLVFHFASARRLSGRWPLASSIAGILVFKRKDSLRHRSSLYYRSGARLRTYRCARRTILCNNLLETENAIFSPQACLPFSRKILAFECTTSPRRLLRSRDAGLAAMPPAQIIFPGRSDIPTGGIIIKMNNLNAAECF
jgi:hypothetical protein